jgi:hypothetical protein
VLLAIAVLLLKTLVQTDLVNACVSTVEGRPRRSITIKLMRYVAHRLTAWFQASVSPTAIPVLKAPLAALGLIPTADCNVCHGTFAAEGAGLWCSSKDHFMCRACFQVSTYDWRWLIPGVGTNGLQTPAKFWCIRNCDSSPLKTDAKRLLVRTGHTIQGRHL